MAILLPAVAEVEVVEASATVAEEDSADVEVAEAGLETEVDEVADEEVHEVDEAALSIVEVLATSPARRQPSKAVKLATNAQGPLVSSMLMSMNDTSWSARNHRTLSLIRSGNTGLSIPS